MSETREEYRRRLHCSHTDFDTLADWYWRALRRIAALEAELEATRRERDALKALVEQVEWVKTGETDKDNFYELECPHCHKNPRSWPKWEHADDCPRQQALGGEGR